MWTDELHRARVPGSHRGMSNRRLLPLVIAGCIAVVIVAALQGPIVFGKPRFDLIMPGNGPDITLSPEPTQQGDEAPDTPTTQPHGLFDPTTILIAISALAAAAIVAAILLGVRALRRRRRGETSTADLSPLSAEPVDTPPATPAPARLARGIQRSLDILDTAVDPQDAVIAAWLGLQESAEDAGYSAQVSETPAEFTVRVLARDDSIARDLRELLGLYQDVRFGDHRATASDITRARDALRAIREVWS